MAVVGSGPAGFYTAHRVMSLIDRAKVDMYEALPVPFGLVRFGVAPDHSEVKVFIQSSLFLFCLFLLTNAQNCQDRFSEVASSPNFTFVGNVSVGHKPFHPDGQSVPLATLMRHYDAVLFAYGAARDRTLNIPGESTLKRIYSAREFVGWYNALPEFAGLAPDLSQDEAVIIGQGNVAVDVARILLADVDRLRKTDMADYALEALSTSKVKRVRIAGRRGPMQAAFTIKEIRELMNLPGVSADPIDSSLIPSDLKPLPRARKRLAEVLLKGSKTPHSSASRSWSLDFCISPTEFHPHPADPDSVGSTTFDRTSLSPDPFDPGARATSTGDTLQLDSPLVFRSIGYKSVALPEFDTLGVAFDHGRGVIRNDKSGGRVLRSTADPGTAQLFPGLYCAGWVKRGPTGVIASTMEDAFATAEAIAGDWKDGKQFLDGAEAAHTRRVDSAGWEGVQGELGRSVSNSAVDWDGWLAIDKAERDRGQLKGKERDKFTATADMLSVPFSSMA
jgi:adrenodoxin-NADP+ reductase